MVLIAHRTITINDTLVLCNFNFNKLFSGKWFCAAFVGGFALSCRGLCVIGEFFMSGALRYVAVLYINGL